MTRRLWTLCLPGLVVFLAGCVEGGGDLARCDPVSHRDDPANCGCAGPCGPGLACQDGTCCDPVQHAFDPDNCGCRGPVPQGQFCYAGHACNVIEHQADPTNCGCKGPCDAGDHCVGGQCVCQFEKHKNDVDNCGCNGPCLSSQQVCVLGQCICDPSKNLDNPDNCGCKGACGQGQVCLQGRCGCPEGQVLCKGVCEPREDSTCLCKPEFHQSDASDCGCHGPCGVGQMCKDGKCACDPVYHANDSSNCGCSGQKCEPGQVCLSGSCVCPQGLVWCAQPTQTSIKSYCSPDACCDPDEHQSDSDNCNCQGPCPEGIACSFGACDKCDPLKNLSNTKNCGCAGACKADEICSNGQCICKPGLYPCFAKTGPFSGQTVCQPEPATSYCADCVKSCGPGTACEVKPGMTLDKYALTGQAIFQCCPPGGCCKEACGKNELCDAGQCVCKSGFQPCMNTAGDLSCVAEVNAKHVCPDCLTVCPDGKCTPTSKGGTACCTQKPDGSTICCTTLGDGTQKCCTSPVGGPNECL